MQEYLSFSFTKLLDEESWNQTSKNENDIFFPYSLLK